MATKYWWDAKAPGYGTIMVKASRYDEAEDEVCDRLGCEPREITRLDRLDPVGVVVQRGIDGVPLRSYFPVEGG